MSKNFVALLLAGSLAVAGGKLFSLNQKYADLQSQNQDLQGQVSNLKAQILKEHMKEETEYLAAQTAVEQLQGQIKTQKEQVTAAEQRLQSERNGGVGGKQLPGLRDKLSQEKQLIADLESRLHDVRVQQDGLRNQDKFYLQQAGMTQKQADDQLKSQISQQQQTLKEMYNQLKAYKQNSVVNPDYAEKYSELRAQIDVQKNTIQQLQDQRNTTNAQWGYQKSTSHSQNQQDLGTLKSSESNLQAQLLRERAALQTMNQDMSSGVQSQKSEEALIQTAQADFTTQKAKLQDLEAQLQQAEQHLAEVSPPKSAEQ